MMQFTSHPSSGRDVNSDFLTMCRIDYDRQQYSAGLLPYRYD